MNKEIEAAVVEAVRSVEAKSCAELVVEVRTRSGSYVHADLRFGSILGFIVLLVVLFSRWTFEPFWVPFDVALAYAAGVAISMSSNAVRRLMTTTSDRNRKVHTSAAAAFVDRGVANTQRESGLLIYLSLLERRIEMIADRGVLDAVPVLEWNQILDSIRTRKATVTSLIEIVRALEPLLVCYLPARAGDRDELPTF